MLFILALAGCSTHQERTGYEKEAGKGRPLDMPPDLVLPKTSGKYLVPEGSTETSATYSEYAKGAALQSQACTCQQAAASQPVSAQAATTPAASAVVAGAPAVPPTLLDKPDGSKSILISEPFDRCWLKVSQAVDKAAIMVEDKDRSKGLLYLKGGNQLSIQGKPAEPGKAETCEVTAATAGGTTSSDTRRTIDALYKNLGK